MPSLSPLSLSPNLLAPALSAPLVQPPVAASALVPAPAQPAPAASFSERLGKLESGLSVPLAAAMDGKAGFDSSLLAGRQIQDALTGQAQDDEKIRRFYMPLIYEPDPAWAGPMQRSVETALRTLQKDPTISFQKVLDLMIAEARTGLKQRAEGFSGPEDKKAKIAHHADKFGILRRGSQRVTYLGERGPLAVFRPLAVANLERFGEHREETQVWGQFSSRRGQPFTEQIYSLQFTYQTPEGAIELSQLESKWIPSHEEPAWRGPWSSLNIFSPKIDATAPMLRALERRFGELKKLRSDIGQGKIAKDAESLRQAIDLTAEIYWMLSQTWPYERGSAGIADLSTKLILDWFGISTPSFKDEANPNIAALVTPLAAFKPLYRSHFQAPFRWLASN